MGGVLPDYIEPLRLAEAGARLGGTLAVGCMPRLASMLIKGAAVDAVCIDFRFGEDGKGHPALTGRVSAALPVACQRCLQAMTIPIDAPVRLRLIRREDEAPAEADVLLVTAEPMSLAHIVEEELLLGMPMAAMHPEADCPVKLPRGANVAKEHPFAALASLQDGGQAKHS